MKGWVVIVVKIRSNNNCSKYRFWNPTFLKRWYSILVIIIFKIGLFSSRNFFELLSKRPIFFSAEHEDKFKNMMKNIFDLKMDRTTTTLMGMMALFSVSHAELQVLFSANLTVWKYLRTNFIENSLFLF